MRLETMLDRPVTPDVRDLTVVVHETIPEIWPSAGDPAEVAARHVFQTREFIEAWMATRGARATVSAYLVEIRNGFGEPILLLPLTITKRGGGRILGFMDGGLADYSAPVIVAKGLHWTEDAARALWELVVAKLPPVDLVQIENMPAMIGNEQNPLALISTAPNPESTHGSDLTLPWEALEATQDQVKRLKQKWRALERVGAVTLKVAEDEADVERILAKVLAQKQRRFDETKVNGFDRDPDKLAYFRRATTLFHAVGALELCALQVGEEIVASAWNLKQGGVVYGILMGFEAGEWTKFSSGRILNLMLLRRLKEAGLRYLDHGIGDEGWKLTSCDTHVPLRQMLEVRSLRGRAMLAARGVKQQVRELRAWKALQPVRWALLRKLGRGNPAA